MTEYGSAKRVGSRPLPHDRESERLASLRATGLLDAQPEARFDRFTELAQTVFDVATAVISLVDADRQWFLSKCGLDADETSRDIAFCAHSIHEDQYLVVEDASEDPRFKDNPLVTSDPYIRFYAGAVLRDPTGLPLGTLCIFDPQPRSMTLRDRNALVSMARMVEHEIYQSLQD
ncbi:GAF domain-containing protein [Pseudohaliea rubra]|uniref:Sensor histidine kinase n=1 Tax=Pseudohaliea rubra DSM 19751 TaxID=1265313 RepID=A0A095XVX3_9GAMM|nr:GAF domain-containing protein [Pseudohaliea rubra]KGE03851.1 Sensor histidine kinase [Pseudohaliea rubra DSM 19751]